MKAVMYHYVRRDSDQLPYFRHLHFDDFCRQLDYFERQFRFISRDEFVHTIRRQRIPPNDAIVLTFDDGLLDHYHFVLPELQRRQLWAIFYIPTGVYTARRTLAVHKVHYLLGRHGGRRMLKELRQRVSHEMLKDRLIPEFRTLTYAFQDNDNATTQFKRILNYYISYAHRDAVIDSLVAEIGDDTSVADFYMTPDMIGRLHKEGMIIGSHSVNHPVLSRLSRHEQQNEIQESFQFLEAATGGLMIRTFCYPYGGFHSFTSETEDLLKQNDTLFSFNVEPRDVERCDIEDRPQALPRYDCNMFSFGQCRRCRGDVAASRLGFSMVTSRQ